MIEKLNVYIQPLESWRTMHIYLPQNYHNSDERYPVMYMYDGHNLFNDQDATYGKSWGLGEF
ncbi:MAG: alpha/beta hydrolase-fold protein, partial [Massilimicrobiota sp.]|nr:alpha/beta hydrolase-fold protein [Massilimicrobiota sp.]